MIIFLRGSTIVTDGPTVMVRVSSAPALQEISNLDEICMSCMLYSLINPVNAVENSEHS